jgi:pheromone shutdown protein TraB
MDGSLTAINGPKGSTLITERNKVVIKVLGKQIAAGKKNIAVFYGAGHMPDIQERLAADLNLVPLSTQWVVAWDLQGKPEKGAK